MRTGIYCGEIYNLTMHANLVGALCLRNRSWEKFPQEKGSLAYPGFGYAGAKNIIVSFWKVADEFHRRADGRLLQNPLQDKSKSFSKVMQPGKT